MNLIPHYWEKYNRSLSAYGADDPVTCEHWGEYVMVHKAEHTALHKPPVANDRVEIPAWEYLTNESLRMFNVLGMHQTDLISTPGAVRELLQSYAEILSIMAQLQKAHDEGK